MFMRIIFCTTFLHVYGLVPTSDQKVTHDIEKSLRTALKSGYDSEVRPYSPTYIGVNYFIRSVEALDIATQSFSHTAFVNIIWHDPRLVWNATDYGNLTSLDIKWAWRPLFLITNGLDAVSMYGGEDNDVRMIVQPNGFVLWQQALHPTTVCEVNVHKFPYDEQSCPIDLFFIGYIYNTDIKFDYTTVDLGVYLQNDEWAMMNHTAETMLSSICCPQSLFGYVQITFTFQRLHSFYLNTFLIPTYLMSVCLIWPFYLPTESGERIGFSLSILLSYTFILSTTTAFLPTTSRQLPVVGGYLVTVLFLCSMTVCNVAINVKIYFLDTEPCNVIKKLYRSIKPIIFLEVNCKRAKNKVKTLKQENMDKPQISDKTPVEEVPMETEEVTWAKVSILLDRICFILYSVTVIVLDLSLIIYLSS